MCVWKRILMVVVLCGPAFGQIKVPRGVREVKDLEAARREASQTRGALIFLMVNTASTQDFVQEALDDYHRRFRTYGPVLLVRAGVSSAVVPEAVVGELEGLKGYPRMVVVDPDDNTIIAKVPYLTIEGREAAMREQRRVIHKYLTEKRKRPRVPPSPVPPKPVRAP